MQTTFDVFGDPVALLLTRKESNNTLTIVTQTCQPGGGPPPHHHVHEDEVFQVLSGRFELYDGAADRWTEIPAGRVVFGPKGHVHTFRNCGDTVGTIQIAGIGGPLDDFLVGLSRFQMPHDMQAMVDYSATFGITYPALPPPSAQQPELQASLAGY